jgi:CheY-like chemotaxis protein
MSPEIRDRVFEPFFTTKEKARGTGLGLAMVYGFLKQCGGHVTIYSEVGHGATFNLYFPHVEEAGGSSTLDATTSQDRASMRETILVVEDDARVRQLTLKRLKIIGYRVLEAENGPKAVEILEKEPSIDLFLTDLIMPGGMSGRDVASRAQELKPGIKVMLTSGYAEELVHGTDLEAERFRALRKPYHLTDLETALREVLGASGRNA